MKTPYSVNEEHWGKLDIFNQMGNIYSEVGRSLKTRSAENINDHNEAVARAIDLFDATIASLINDESPKAKEVLRSKEQFLDIVNDKDASQEVVNGLERYFMQYAIAARLNR